MGLFSCFRTAHVDGGREEVGGNVREAGKTADARDPSDSPVVTFDSAKSADALWNGHGTSNRQITDAAAPAVAQVHGDRESFDSVSSVWPPGQPAESAVDGGGGIRNSLDAPFDRMTERPRMSTVAEDGRSHSLKQGESAGARRRQSLAQQFGAHGSDAWRFDASTRAQSHTEAHLMEPLHNHRRYQKLKTLHRGNVSFVQLALNKDTGQQVAIKFLLVDDELSGPAIMAELLAQRRCRQHPHIVQLQEVFSTKGHLGIVMDFHDGGNMAQYMAHRKGTPLDEDEARRLFQAMASAVAYVAALGITHHDLKLDNFLLHQGLSMAPLPSLADFAFARHLDSPMMSAAGAGTPEYVSPEVLSTQQYQDAPADVWSLGVCLYVLLTGSFPFLTADEEAMSDIKRMQAMFPRIMSGDFEPLPSSVSPSCAKLLRKMLTVDPDKRITADEVFNHPWTQTNMPEDLRTVNSRLLDEQAAAKPWPPLAAAALVLQASGGDATLEQLVQPRRFASAAPRTGRVDWDKPQPRRPKS